MLPNNGVDLMVVVQAHMQVAYERHKNGKSTGLKRVFKNLKQTETDAYLKHYLYFLNGWHSSFQVQMAEATLQPELLACISLNGYERYSEPDDYIIYVDEASECIKEQDYCQIRLKEFNIFGRSVMGDKTLPPPPFKTLPDICTMINSLKFIMAEAEKTTHGDQNATTLRNRATFIRVAKDISESLDIIGEIYNFPPQLTTALKKQGFTNEPIEYQKVEKCLQNAVLSETLPWDNFKKNK